MDYPILESATDSWERYIRVRALTMRLYPAVNIQRDGNLLNCWKAIAHTWDEVVYPLCGINYISEALYHIHYRCFSNQVNISNELLLVLLIEEELLRCSFAFQAWQNMEEFGRLYYNILYVRQRDGLRKDYNSMKLSEYLRANTIRRIMLKDRNPLKWGGVLDCNKATYPDCAISTYWCVVAYENAVQLLIPEAIFWQEEWSSEEPIVSAIKSRYAVDLSDDSDSFDALINLVEHRKEARHCSYALYGMQQFTNELAIGIWGEQADFMMQKCFLDIYRRYKIGRRNRKRSKYSI
jgi:hypothetical protein